MCDDQWNVKNIPDCEIMQFGCPDIACEDKNKSRWCLLRETPCIPNGKYPVFLDDNYMECGGESLIFGKDSKKKSFVLLFSEKN